MPSTSSALTRELAAPLLAWFDEHARDLPWRGIQDPYRTWVSEIMLQQTRVDTVLRYYDRFLERFPTLASLAAASEDEVLTAWAGLGFYRRARNLHCGARLVMERHGGELPRDPQQLGELPGLGRYTVGAILSIAHDLPLPILDGNVIRVLSRVLRIAGDPTRAQTKKQLWAAASDVLPARRRGDFNQSLMELGALLCSPKSPSCEACPLSALCGAASAGDQETFPWPSRKAKVVELDRVALYLERPDGQFRMVQRPPRGLLASLWELPSGEIQRGKSAKQTAEQLLRGLGGRGKVRFCGRSEHRFSHRLWRTRIYRSKTRARAVIQAGTWVDPTAIGELAVPTAVVKMLRAIG